MINIYTDGACSGNPGPGGWAAIIVDGEKRKEVKGGDENTTNNRMELTAAIEGLAKIPGDSEVTVHSDSLYLVNTMTKNWKRNVNHDLWEKLDKLVAKRQVTWVWVKGHEGHPENEQADRLAVEMIPTVSKKPTHFDTAGQVHMVDVTEKDITERIAIAKGTIKMESNTLELIETGQAAKGDVLALAQIAGIMAAKKTSDLIPLCHPLQITNVSVDFDINSKASEVNITATVKATDKTGVEMEALTAVAVSALTIYDMCKAVDRGMIIENIRLVEKSGGKSGTITLL